LLATAGVTHSGHAQVIDTRTGERISAVTVPRFGQTFTVPVGATSLIGFSFFLRASGPTPATIRGALMRWNGSAGVGDVLYASASRQGPPGAFIEEAFVTNVLPVMAGEQYVAFLEQAVGTVQHGRAASGGVLVDSYAGGAAVITSCTASVVVGCGWGVEQGRDAEFVARFNSTTVVPEPRSMAMLASGGALCLALVARRRRRRSC
jgi:hypothetical protein